MLVTSKQKNKYLASQVCFLCLCVIVSSFVRASDEWNHNLNVHVQGIVLSTAMKMRQGEDPRHVLLKRRHYVILPTLMMLLPLHLLLVARCVTSMVLPPTSTQPTNINEIIKSPHIGYIKDPVNKLETFVIGTSHFRCSSASEVTSLITQVRPDGVVLELDPERVLRLTKQYHGFDADSQAKAEIQTTTSDRKELLYGSDFVAAVQTASELDIPLFLGDEYAQETKHRLMQQLFRAEAYSPTPLVNSILPDTSANSKGDNLLITSRISLFNSFQADPKKLTPLAVSSSPALIVTALAFLFQSNEAAASFADGSSSGALDWAIHFLETSISIILSFFVSCFLFNTVIVERDEILADSTIRAWDVLRSLKNGSLIRKRWKFSVDTMQNDDDEVTTSFDTKTELPLFTLKTPLMKGKIRNLNLFEPRWLKMIDSVTKDNTALPQFGCVRCANKFYSAISSKNGAEGRYADVIFERRGALASIVGLTEGKRPVSGDRKIGVQIEGVGEFLIDNELSSISVVDDGYMVAKKWNMNDLGVAIKSDDKWVRIVVVVGLLHGNGVIKLLSKGSTT